MAAERFEEHRALLTGVAYRVLGTLADAEDVVQEAWLRWTGVDASTVEDDRAYLIKVTTRLSIDRLRRVRAQRESYVGPWLPELVGTTPDVAEHVELSASVELALLVVLETLSPLERAVFVLREAFALPYAEIGEIIGRSEPATRQLARRGREHVQERRPRFDVDRDERRRLTERFVDAAAGGDLEALTAMLSADASLVGDGGGRVSAPLRVIAGADKVARFLISIGGQEGTRKFMRAAGADPASGFAVGFADVNGGPAAVMTADGRPIAVFSLVVGDGLIEAVFLVANPEKMSRL
ncbi:RNA polymerase sigma factor SigJ [Streptosporangium lutulentum]|uniref:RNA polymerase sigma-70 factor (ECF subfamily) n=1 Tax=Streptosporangium lutulentum TaxID=1461250 RepID=A0ABT9QTY0_9ACTN|nr:RNA polymerase sigma factor SigJ [Streptosporangium lutulentum]MDP9850227.1 RNA polymerase sigma-70 factor (ECF subfamily) [Streptosporangium lutulentum]